MSMISHAGVGGLFCLKLFAPVLREWVSQLICLRRFNRKRGNKNGTSYIYYASAD